jgi:tetratricopeptide (TPR) repeat protein
MDQTTETFLRIEAIFHEALAIPDEARPDLVAARCEGDGQMAAEVNALLEACQAEESETASRRGSEAVEDGKAEAKRIGPYLLDSLLGRGGMGAVYLAHRADGQFEQKVAIKLIDLPLATELFRERFRQERQILAGLQHPFIARLLDGGVSQDGDLYLAMEYVDGVPIHTFCEDRKLSQVQRLTLFMQVCEAVQFAHQNLVVHRDLKPDNIFVGEDGTPRLLDFGTAKLLSPSLANPGSEMTREGFQSFTPQYASPEQVLGNPITTASDTYSLGVLMYLLLTGTLPYELKELTTAEMLRVVCKEPPRKPGPAVGTDRRLDSDLEAILNKALRKEPQARYLTAEQLSGDVRAYLDGKPVGARHGTLRYRAAKFVRRHRFGLVGAALLAVTLIAGVAGVLWQARVANAERRKSEARSADLRQLSNSLLSELDEAIKQLPGSTNVQKLLVTRVLEHLDRMAKDAQGDRLTQLDLIDAYTRLGNIQGNAYDQNLGDPAGGLASLDKALALAVPLAASGPSDREALRALALVEQSRSEVLWQNGKTPEAVVAMQAAVKSFDALIADPRATAALIGDAAGAYGNLGDELGQPGTPSLEDLSGALAAYRKTIDLDNRALTIDPSFLRSRRGLAIMQMKIGSVDLATDPALALKDFDLALQQTAALPADVQSALATVRLRSMLLRKKANALMELGQFEQAVPIFGQVVQVNRHLAAGDLEDLRAQVDVEVVLDDEAESYEFEADPALGAMPGDRRKSLLAAKGLLAESAAIMEKLRAKVPANEEWKSVLADVQVRLATVESALKESGDFASLAKAGIVSMRETVTQNEALPKNLDQAAHAFLTVEPESLRDPQSAVTCAKRAVALKRGQLPSQLLTLAEAYHATGAMEESRSAARQGLALLPPAQAGSAKPLIRRLLEIQAQPGR